MRNWLAGRGRWAGAVRRLKTTQRSVCVKRYSCTTENRESRKLVVRYVLLPFWGILPSQALETGIFEGSRHTPGMVTTPCPPPHSGAGRAWALVSKHPGRSLQETLVPPPVHLEPPLKGC
nr:uncharacterized protein LOC106822798 isoform X1 [Equus asinus]